METGHLDPKDRHLPVCAGVHHTANALYSFTHGAGSGPALSALEGQMFDEMGYAGQFV